MDPEKVTDAFEGEPRATSSGYSDHNTQRYPLRPRVPLFQKGSSGHAADLVRGELELPSGMSSLTLYDAICVVGGDGTMHEVVDGMMGRFVQGRW